MIFWLTSLSGCQNSELDYLTNDREDVFNNVVTTVDDATIVDDGGTIYYYIYSNAIVHVIPSANRIMLIDLLTGNILAESEDIDYLLFEITSLQNGYWGVWGRGSEPEEGWNLENWHFWEESEVYFLVFNRILELVEQFEITDAELLWQRNHATFNYQNRSLVFYFNDWSVWGEEGIYQYNATNHEKTLRVKNNEFYFWNLQHIDESRILFIGSRMNVQTHYYYGMIHLDTGEIQYNSMNFQPKAIIIEGNYALITEHPAGFLQGDDIGFNYRGEVAIFNLKAEESRIIQLEGAESGNALVVNDRYILTGNCMTIRLYDINTGKVVREESILRVPGLEGCLEEIFPFIYKYLVINDAQFAVVFQVSEDEFHTEIFGIEE